MTPTAARHTRLVPAGFPSPEGLAILASPGTGDGGSDLVVCVHGTLDRGGSFSRVARRLEEPVVVAYDRRGYQGSRTLPGPYRLSRHVEDLLEVTAAARDEGKVTVVGHSFGGVIAIAAALAAPGAIDSVIVYEPPLPWLAPEDHPLRGTPLGDDPALEVERFFRHMVSDAAWDHLGEGERADRIADGPAMVGDLSIVRMETPFDFDDLRRMDVPLTIVMGSSPVAARHRATAEKVVATVPEGRMLHIEGAGHGAHLSHPDRLAALIDEHRARSTSREGAHR